MYIWYSICVLIYVYVHHTHTYYLWFIYVYEHHRYSTCSAVSPWGIGHPTTRKDYVSICLQGLWIVPLSSLSNMSKPLNSRVEWSRHVETEHMSCFQLWIPSWETGPGAQNGNPRFFAARSQSAEARVSANSLLQGATEMDTQGSPWLLKMRNWR